MTEVVTVGVVAVGQKRGSGSSAQIESLLPMVDGAGGQCNPPYALPITEGSQLG